MIGAFQGIAWVGPLDDSSLPSVDFTTSNNESANSCVVYMCESHSMAMSEFPLDPGHDNRNKQIILAFPDVLGRMAS